MINQKLQWTEKYRPDTLSKVVGQNKAIEELKSWANAWNKGIPKNRAILLHGKAGIGKSSISKALANDMKWEILELNASDQRTADVIHTIVGLSSQSNTFDGNKQLIVMDEADNIHGTSDRGGEKEIIKIIKMTKQPIILIANELYDMSPTLRSSCKLIQFNEIPQYIIVSVLKHITENESIKCNIETLNKLAENSNGDLRSSINDLQAISEGKNEITIDDIVTDERDVKKNIFKFLETVFSNETIKTKYNEALNLNENPETLIQWIEENISKNNVSESYKYLGKASTFLGRSRKSQNYRMWKYASILMMNTLPNNKTRYNSPSLWKNLGQTKGIRTVRESVSKKIGNYCHVSSEYTKNNLLTNFKIMMKNDNHAEFLINKLDFRPEEIAFLIDSELKSKKVKELYEKYSPTFILTETKIEEPKKEKVEHKKVEIPKVNKSQKSVFDF